VSIGKHAVELRRATFDDAEAIAAIWRDGWRDAHLGNVPGELVAARTPESFSSRAAQRVGDTVVAVVDGTIAGFVMVVDDEVEQIYVARGHRGTGAAAALLGEAERLVWANGYGRAWLAVVPGNVRARRFYERMGWADEGVFDYPAADAGRTITVPCLRYVKVIQGTLSHPLTGQAD
jgi:GNAT superfamily N-acetyltransferase